MIMIAVCPGARCKPEPKRLPGVVFTHVFCTRCGLEWLEGEKFLTPLQWLHLLAIRSYPYAFAAALIVAGVLILARVVRAQPPVRLSIGTGTWGFVPRHGRALAGAHLEPVADSDLCRERKGVCPSLGLQPSGRTIEKRVQHPTPASFAVNNSRGDQ